MNFLTGFRVENGFIISKFIKTENLAKSTDCGASELINESDTWYDGCLDEVILVSPPKYVYVVELQEVFYTGGTEGQDYYYSVENSTSGAGGGSSTYSEPSEEDEKVEETDAFKENDKINCTYKQLKKTTSIQEILKDFFGDDAIFDVTFNVVDNLNCNGNTNASGCTTDLGGNAYRIDIDLGYINDPTTPTIFLAQTMIHEAVHANLFAAVKS